MKYRLLVFGIGLSFLIWGIVGALTGAILPEIRERFFLSATAGGSLFTCWSMGFVLGSMAAGRLLHRTRPKRTLVYFLILAVGISFLLSIVREASTLYPLYGALGLSGGAVFTSSHTLIAGLFLDQRTSALSGLDLVFSLGNMVAPLAVTALLKHGMHWPVCYLILALCLALPIAFIVVGRSYALVPSESPQSRREKRPIRGIMVQPVTIATAVGSVALGAVEWTQNVWFVSFASQAHGVELARIALSLFTAGMIAARVAIMCFGRTLGRPAYVYLMLLMAIVGSLAVCTAQNLGALLVANFVLGLGIGAVLPVFLGLSMDEHPSDAAAYSMVVIVSVTLGGQLASLAMGILADRFGLLKAYWLIVAVAFFLAASFCFRLFSIKVKNLSGASQ